MSSRPSEARQIARKSYDPQNLTTRKILRTDAGLQRLELFKLALEPVALRRIGRRCDAAFGGLDGCNKHVAIEIVDRRRRVGKDGQTLGMDLGKPADDHDAKRTVVAMDRHDSRSQGCHHGRMAGQYAEVALCARHVDLIDVTRKQKFFGRYEIKVESGHEVAPWNESLGE